MSAGTRRSTTPVRRDLARSTATFASTMLIIAGAGQILVGIAAVANDQIYVRGGGYAYQLDVTAWGWVHIVVGACAAAGCGTIYRQWWARVGGIMGNSLPPISRLGRARGRVRPLRDVRSRHQTHTGPQGLRSLADAPRFTSARA